MIETAFVKIYRPGQRVAPDRKEPAHYESD